MAVNAPEAGILKELLANEEDTVTVDQEIAKIEPGTAPEGGEKSESKEAPKQEEASTEAKPAPTEAENKPEPKQESKPEPSTPAPAPSTPKKEAAPKQSQPAKETSAPTGPTLGSREERRVKMNRMRLRIAERLKQSQNTAASLTTFNEVDMSQLIDFRKQYKDEVLQKTGVKLGYMAAFARAAIPVSYTHLTLPTKA